MKKKLSLAVAMLTVLSLLPMPQVRAQALKWRHHGQAQISQNYRHYSQQDFDTSWLSVRTFDFADDKPINVYVESYTESRPGFKAEYVEYVHDSLEQWSKALDGRLQYRFVPSPSDAQIRVFWVHSLPEKDDAGVTDFTIGDAMVKVRTMGFPDNQIAGTITHELGHALGISNHSDANEDIMKTGRKWASRQEYLASWPKVSQRDVMAIRRLYGDSWRPGEDLYQAIDSASQTPKVLSAVKANSKFAQGLKLNAPD